MIKKITYFLLPLYFLIIIGCASTRTSVNFYKPIMNDLKTENYSAAAIKIDKAKQKEDYTKKDRVLYYLDKGAVLHYQGEYKKSNECLEEAERAMEELFTKSISKSAASFLLNDNALDYYGEIYENLYVNVFKAINYLKLNKFDDAYVEIKRVNDKLRELDDKYSKMVEEMNKSDKAEVKIEKKTLKFYDDALAHYLSYLIFRAEGEYDNSRISNDKIKTAWKSQPDVYDFSMPSIIKNVKESQAQGKYLLNVIAFTGRAPLKYSVGGKITTYDNFIGISNLSVPITAPNIPFPGVKPGYHFKFAFPQIRPQGSVITKIEVYVDNNKAGELELLEDMSKVAVNTFEMKKDIIYLKTIARTVVKGIAAAKAKKKIKKETGANPLFGALINIATDAAVDATENPDLRNWRTMPQNCYIGEFAVSPGIHNIIVNFYNRNGLLVKKKSIANYEIKNNLNLINVVSLN
jgi:hypothetical protein